MARCAVRVSPKRHTDISLTITKPFSALTTGAGVGAVEHRAADTPIPLRVVRTRIRVQAALDVCYWRSPRTQNGHPEQSFQREKSLGNIGSSGVAWAGARRETLSPNIPSLILVHSA
jgi:hypothetical protein